MSANPLMLESKTFNITVRDHSHSPEQRTMRLHLDFVLSILTDILHVHAAAKLLVDQLQAVTDAQNRHAQLENVRVVGGRIGGVHRVRAARYDDAAVVGRTERLGGRVQRQNVGQDLQLADAPVDDLRVLECGR